MRKGERVEHEESRRSAVYDGWRDEGWQNDGAWGEKMRVGERVSLFEGDEQVAEVWTFGPGNAIRVARCWASDAVEAHEHAGATAYLITLGDTPGGIVHGYQVVPRGGWSRAVWFNYSMEDQARGYLALVLEERREALEG